MPSEDASFVDSADGGSQPEVDLRRPIETTYRELKVLAERQLAGERSNHTLLATALVNEAYLRLEGNGFVPKNRAHFFGAAAEAMRRILVDYARSRLAAKRGGGASRIPLDEDLTWFEEKPQEVIEVDRALQQLAKLDAQKAQMVKLRYFLGLTHEQIAELTGRSARSIKRDWQFARAWLNSELSR